MFINKYESIRKELDEWRGRYTWDREIMEELANINEGIEQILNLLSQQKQLMYEHHS